MPGARHHRLGWPGDVLRRPSWGDAPFLLLLVAGAVLRMLTLAQTTIVAVATPHVGSATGLLTVSLLHVTGLATAVGLYVLVVRWGAWRWLAALAAVPVLLDGRVLAAEQVVTAAAAVPLAVSLVVLAGCWRSRPLLATAALVGVTVPVLIALDHWTAPVTTGPDQTVHALRLEVPGTLTLLALAVAVLAAVGLGRAAGSLLRPPTVVVAVLPLAVAVAASPRDPNAWTGVVPALVWWPGAAALGLTALLRGRRGADASLPQEDAVDAAARAAFHRRYGVPTLAPVVVVIAAYNEASGLPRVLAAIPERILGLRCDVLVVDDGSSDGTAEALRETRAYAVPCPVNRGQGAALRLGYRLAAEHHARYVVTTDADGQYDVADLPVVLAPLVRGQADLVTGSRILGHQHTHDRVRRLGVHVFAWLASGLVGSRLTDTSFGLRAARAEVPAALTLNQPQYQSSELLLGALSHGLRVTEVPGTMHVRTAGTTKKGRNTVYATRYARAMLGTWWREGCPRPATDVPAVTRGVRARD